MANNAIKGAADAYAVAHYRFYTSDPDEPVPYQQDLRDYKSSEARLDAVINEVISEIAKLREELAAAQALAEKQFRQNNSIIRDNDKLMERAEAAEAETAKAKHVAHALSVDLIAAEAKLKAASEQEPRYFVQYQGQPMEEVDTEFDFFRAEAHGARTEKFYASPIPPADVQHTVDVLQAEIDRLAGEVANRNRRAVEGDEAVAANAQVHEYYEKRVSELERKLAEQQAAIQSKNQALLRWTVGTCVCQTKTHEPEQHALNCPYRIAQEAFNVSPDTAELNALLAQAEERGMKKAVPEGWQVVPKEPTEEMVRKGATCVYSDWAYAAMLAAAPKPEVKPC